MQKLNLNLDVVFYENNNIFDRILYLIELNICRGRCFCYMLKFLHSTARTLCVLEQNLLDLVAFSYVKTFLLYS